MKIFSYFIFFLLTLNLIASDLKPANILKANGGVTDLVIDNNRLFAATINSSVDIFDLNSKEKINSIKLPKIKDFTGDLIEAKVYSTDALGDKVLILSQGKSGGRNIFIYENEKLTNLIDDEKRLFIAYAKFLDKERIIYALLSNQIFIYNIKNGSIEKELQISQSKFSNFKLSNDKSKVVVSDESGTLSLIDIKTLKLIQAYKGQNVDNVFQVDFKNDTLIGGGQDRRCTIYSIDNKVAYYKASNFLVYSVALSPSAKKAAFGSEENNDVTIFDTVSKQDLVKLTDIRNTLTSILFLNENEIFVASDDNIINYYKLGE